MPQYDPNRSRGRQADDEGDAPVDGLLGPAPDLPPAQTGPGTVPAKKAVKKAVAKKALAKKAVAKKAVAKKAVPKKAGPTSAAADQTVAGLTAAPALGDAQNVPIAYVEPDPVAVESGSVGSAPSPLADPIVAVPVEPQPVPEPTPVTPAERMPPATIPPEIVPAAGPRPGRTMVLVAVLAALLALIVFWLRRRRS